MDSFPAAFEPYDLRSGARYKDLSNYRFSKSEIDWLCRRFRSSSGSYRRNRSLSRFCVRYNLSLEKIILWLELNDGTAHSSHLTSIKSEADLPLDVVSIQRLSNWINGGNDGRSSREVLEDELRGTEKRRSSTM